jgi:mRNA interferase HigB
MLDYHYGNFGPIMRILGLPLIDEFKLRAPEARGALDAWRNEVASADWQRPQDIKDRYRSADFLADNRVIFNIKGKSYRLVVKVRYQNGLVQVEWVGTHAEYSKRKF